MNLFKDYKGTNEISATPYGLGALLVSVYGQTQNVELQPLTNTNTSTQSITPVMGEVLIQTIAHSTLDYVSATERSIIQALYYLNARVESVRKTITTWDAYQIKGALQDRDTILAQLAQLPANSSIVSNLAEPFQWFDGEKNVTVFKGDILLKDSEENIWHIPSLSSGYYAPVSMHPTSLGATTYQIDFHYYTTTPQDDTTLFIFSTNADTTPLNVTWTSGSTTIIGTLTAEAANDKGTYLVPGTQSNVYRKFIVTGTSPNKAWQESGTTNDGFDSTNNIQFSNVETREDYWGYQLKGTLNPDGGRTENIPFKVDQNNEIVLKPIVKFFTDETDGEQIYLNQDYYYILDGNTKKFYLQNDSSIVVFYEVK